MRLSTIYHVVLLINNNIHPQSSILLPQIYATCMHTSAKSRFKGAACQLVSCQNPCTLQLDTFPQIPLDHSLHFFSTASCKSYRRRISYVQTSLHTTKRCARSGPRPASYSSQYALGLNALLCYDKAFQSRQNDKDDTPRHLSDA